MIKNKTTLHKVATGRVALTAVASTLLSSSLSALMKYMHACPIPKAQMVAKKV